MRLKIIWIQANPVQVHVISSRREYLRSFFFVYELATLLTISLPHIYYYIELKIRLRTIRGTNIETTTSKTLTMRRTNVGSTAVLALLSFLKDVSPESHLESCDKIIQKLSRDHFLSIILIWFSSQKHWILINQAKTVLLEVLLESANKKSSRK